MYLNDLLKKKREDIRRLAEAYGASDVRILGSVARGEADEKSDIDLLVKMKDDYSLFDLGGLWADMQDLLGCRVDVVPETGLRDRIKERVMKEAIRL